MSDTEKEEIIMLSYVQYVWDRYVGNKGQGNGWNMLLLP
jgi:hypothetical protein